jgi:hypothetical protein
VVLGGRVVVDGAAVVVVVDLVVVDLVVVEVVAAVVDVASLEDPAHAPAISVIVPNRQATIAMRDDSRFMDPW